MNDRLENAAQVIAIQQSMITNQELKLKTVKANLEIAVSIIEDIIKFDDNCINHNTPYYWQDELKKALEKIKEGGYDN